MAWGPDGRVICRRPFISTEFFRVALIVFAVHTQALTKSHAQPGFVSIDCGSNKSSYTDSRGLEWVTDSGSYMTLGNISDQTVSLPNVDDYRYLQTFRYFPERRNKYCYTLTSDPSKGILIRASFYMNKSVLKKRLPFQFNLYIDSNNWFTLTSGGDAQSDLFVTQEAILTNYYSQRTQEGPNICLQPVIGVPFISSLELRSIDSTMYSYNGADNQYLALFFRYNIGANSTSLAVRFPDDRYDRIWYSPGASWYDLLPILSSPAPPDNKTGADVNYVPPRVMADSWTINSTSYGEDSALYFYLYPYTPYLQTTTPTLYAALWMYAENLVPNPGTDSMGVLLGSDENSANVTIPVSNKSSMGAIPNFPSLLESLQIHLSTATVGALNGIEAYAQRIFNSSSTDNGAISVLQQNFSLTDWQGDPCLPVPNDWIACVQEDTNNCNSTTPGGILGYPCDPEDYSSVYYVTEINLSNLPPGNFRSFVDSAVLAQQFNSFDVWYKLSITSSGVDSPNFEYIVQQFNTSSTFNVTILDFSDNDITRIPPDYIWGTDNLASLNLSHNKLGGVLNSFENVSFSTTLQDLNLSNNALTSLPSSWPHTTVNSLVVLDLSYNQFNDSISSLDQLVKINAMSLKHLNVSHNHFTGILDSSLYFLDLPNITVVSFDGNLIQGTLDLSHWLNKLQKANYSNTHFEYSSTSLENIQLFSFVDNRITDIFPEANAFASIMPLLQIMQTLQGGILLGGNPYCEGAKVYIQKYLCRFGINDIVPNEKKKNSNVVLIVSISAGIPVFLLCCVISIIIWRLWKQVYDLRQLQQALMKQKVQPPFYPYSDLKAATRDFHKDNKLGSGGFGAVYKGVLGDGTLIAVKRLFNSQEDRVLNDFLNEVVLITSIRHRNLVHLNGCCINKKERMLVYEFAEKGNLAEALWGSRVHGGLNWEQRFNICIEVARGISYLHEELQPSIIHRDIKPENILLDNKFKPKIADFGLARKTSDESNETLYTKVAGTFGYFSPEYATQGQLSDKVDVYSYGIVVMEIVSGRKCIDHSLPLETRFLKNWVLTMHEKGTLMDVLQTELKEECVVDQVIQALQVALLCAQQDPKRRPLMSQVVAMLSGSGQLEFFQDNPRDAQSRKYFKDFLADIDHKMEFPTQESIIEDSSNHLLLSRLSSSSTRDKHGIKSLVEMTSLRSSRSL